MNITDALLTSYVLANQDAYPIIQDEYVRIITFNTIYYNFLNLFNPNHNFKINIITLSRENIMISTGSTLSFLKLWSLTFF